MLTLKHKFWLGRTLLSLAAVQYGFVPVAVDWSNTHVFHSDWPAHARFHMVWLLTIGLVIAMSVLTGIWTTKYHQITGRYFPALLGFIPLIGFFASAIFINFYGGSLSDLEHPIEIFGIDGNLFSFSIAIIFQTVGYLFYIQAKSF